MKVFVDTNVLLDYLNCRAPYFDDAAIIVGLCVDGIIDGVISLLSIVNCMYITRKMYAKDDLYNKLQWILNVFSVSSITRSDIHKASSLRQTDFEDAVQFYSAARCKVEYIITRDKTGFRNSSIPFLTPTEFIAKCRS